MKKTLLVLCLMASGAATAATLPQRTAFDARVQTVMYNADDVVRVKTKAGISTLIQLESGEFLTEPVAGMGLGDPLAWKVSVRGNNIFLRPVAENPDTNVTLVSNKRTYIFSLESAQSASSASYLVRFTYPEEPKARVFNKPPMPCTGGVVNRNYVKWGDVAIAPSAAWDDGRFVCFRFPSSTDMPVVYRKLLDGSEALVNYHMEQDVMVVHEVASEYRFRLGKAVLGVSSASVTPALFNSKGTTSGEQREIKKQ